MFTERKHYKFNQDLEFDLQWEITIYRLIIWKSIRHARKEKGVTFLKIKFNHGKFLARCEFYMKKKSLGTLETKKKKWTMCYSANFLIVCVASKVLKWNFED